MAEAWRRKTKRNCLLKKRKSTICSSLTSLIGVVPPALIEQREMRVLLPDDPEVVRRQVENQIGVVDASNVLQMRKKKNVDHVVFFVQLDVSSPNTNWRKIRSDGCRR